MNLRNAAAIAGVLMLLGVIAISIMFILDGRRERRGLSLVIEDTTEDDAPVPDWDDKRATFAAYVEQAKAAVQTLAAARAGRRAPWLNALTELAT